MRSRREAEDVQRGKRLTVASPDLTEELIDRGHQGAL